MERNYKRTKLQSWSQESMAAAIEDFKKKEITYLQAAKNHNIPISTLWNNIKKAKMEDPSFLELTQKKLLSVHKTFSEAQEEELVKHILLLKERFGLTLIDVRKLAFEFAEKNNIPHQFNEKKKKAEKTWLDSFLSRHKQLPQEMFEETSPASAEGFNHTAAQSFFNLLQSVYNKYKFSPNNIYNVGETGIIIEPNKSSKVLALRGNKQVGSLSSRNEVLVTAETCMSAAGKYMPTMFVFPIKKVSSVLIDDSSPDSFTVYHESGLIQKDSFIIWFKKFIEFSRPSPEKPVLLLLDGHASHTKSVELIKLEQENNVIILSFPPHCTHRLQPLDVSFISPLMTYYQQEVQKWQIHYPRQDVTIYKVATLYKKAFSRAAQRQTATEGFKKSGIFPLNKKVLANLNAPPKAVEKPIQQEIQDDEDCVISGNDETHPSTFVMSSIFASQKEKNIQERN